MKFLRAGLIVLVALFATQVHAATTLLPNGKQCFSNANGALAGGSVYMYSPGTTTFKQTWQDSGQTILNSQPISLDSNGCAIIYGVGIYRQQVYTGADNTTTLVWDQLTTDTSAYNSVFWAGLSGGTPNVITVVDTGFNGTDGAVIQFVALATNTGSATLNPSGFGAVPIVKDTTAGPVALTGGEIIQNNLISVVYSASSNSFHLLNTVIASASGAIAPLCGANNLKIQPSSGTSDTNITITADNVVMVTTGGLVINRGSVNQTINITNGTVTSTAGGMDGEAPGTNAWLYIWMIDNGASPAGLASVTAGNGLTPNMPSGYTYKCRMGAMRVDGASHLLKTLQRGALVQYALVSPSNTQSYPSMGTTTSATLTPFATGNFVPPTASAISVLAETGTNNSNMSIAPNNVSSATLSSTNPSILATLTGVAGQLSGTIMLESTNIFAATNTGIAINLFAWGYRDQVNAN